MPIACRFVASQSFMQSASCRLRSLFRPLLLLLASSFSPRPRLPTVGQFSPTTKVDSRPSHAQSNNHNQISRSFFALLIDLYSVLPGLVSHIAPNLGRHSPCIVCAFRNMDAKNRILRLCLRISLLLNIAIVSWTSYAQATCYQPNGTVAPQDIACNPTHADSWCCAIGYSCMSDQICKMDPSISSEVTLYNRATCSDKNWVSSVCPTFCGSKHIGLS